MTILIRNRVAASVRFLLALFVVGTAPAALAAIGELDITYPYTPLGPLGSSINGVSGVSHGLGNVKLSGWTFPMGGTDFSQVLVSADGYMALGTGQSVCGCTSSAGTDYGCYPACYYYPPSGEAYAGCNPYCEVFAPPFGPGLIAPFWAPFESNDGVIGTISSLQGGSTGSHYVVIDYNGVGSSVEEEVYSCNPNCGYTFDDVSWSYQFQVILFESGAIVFNYGTGNPNTTLNGEEFEDYYDSFITGAYFPPAGGDMSHTDAGAMLGPSKLYANACMTYWEEYGEDCYPDEGAWGLLNSAYMGELNTPFLSSTPTPTAGPTAGGGPGIDISVTITNNGKDDQAANFPVVFFLVPQGEPPFSLPATCAGEPTCLGQMTFSQAVAAGGSATDSVAGLTLPNPLPPSGLYAVASVIDPTNTTVNATAPLLEIGESTTLLPFGQDMTGKIEVTNFSAVSPTEFTVPIDFTNVGLEDCITADYSVYFFGQAGNAGTGATGTVNGASALTTQTKNVDITIPAGLPQGIYELQLSIGPGLPTDLNMANNVVLGIQPVENGLDMTALIDSVPFSIPSPTTFQVPVTFRNIGLQPATNIGWTMALTSADGTTSAQIGGDQIASLAGLTDLPQALPANLAQTLPAGAYTLSVTIVAAGDLDISNNIVIDPTPIFIYAANADYAISASDLVMNASTHVADGQVVGVTRTIHNLQGGAGPCPYSYFLNPVGVTQIGNGVPVAIISQTGPTYLGTTPPFAAFGQPGDENMATDQVVIPDGMTPGNYNLVLALDPNNQVNDINLSNNDAAIAINVAANPLQITSPSSLTAAIVNVPYLYQLTEQGGGNQVSWSLLAGSLPPGITLDAAGELSGTPTATGVFNLVAQLSSQGGTQVAVLQLPVASGSGALQVELSGSALPTGIAGSPYLQSLTAQGGVPPYSWKGTIPIAFNMTISPSGVLSGNPLQPTNGPVQFTVIVTDSIGTQAQATLTLQIIAPGALTITTPFLQPAVVGTQYDQPILASDGTVTGAVFQWTQPAGAVLPSGIKFQEIGTPAVADLSGIPTQAGIFPIVVNLSDNFGHTATRQYILTVTESPVPVPKQTLPSATLGESYAAQLQATSLSTLTWRIFSGQLPPGLTLAPTGAISGTVPVGTILGTYPFAVAVTDATGAESVVPLEILVQSPPLPGGGCATGTGPAAAGLLLLGMFWLARRRSSTRPSTRPSTQASTRRSA